MKTTIKAAILLLTTLLISTSQVVLADDGDTLRIDAVRDALNDGIDDSCYGIGTLYEHKQGKGRAGKICDGLNKKLDDADAKHKQRKDGDAKKKLCDFGVTLYKLANRDKPIISLAEYDGVFTPLLQAQAFLDPQQVCVLPLP